MNSADLMAADAPRPEVHIDRAEWAGPEFTSMVQSFRESVAGGVLDFSGQYSVSDWDLTTDTLHWFDPGGADKLRSTLRRVGSQFSATFADLDSELLEFDTGRLIRAVLHGTEGVLFGNIVVPDRHVIAFGLGAAATRTPGQPLADHEEVQQADITAADLADGLRIQLSLLSLDPGGWYSAFGRDDDEPVETTVELQYEGTVDDATRELCSEVFGDGFVHYLAYCPDGNFQFSLDCFDHPNLSRFFEHLSRADRRRAYRKQAEEAVGLISQLGRLASPALGPRLDRVVFDVEQGALFYYRIGTGKWLVGVTLRQDRVSEADSKMAWLAQRWRERVETGA